MVMLRKHMEGLKEMVSNMNENIVFMLAESKPGCNQPTSEAEGFQDRSTRKHETWQSMWTQPDVPIAAEAFHSRSEIEDEGAAKLQKLFQFREEEEERLEALNLSKLAHGSIGEFVRAQMRKLKTDRSFKASILLWFDYVLDSVMGFIIAANAVFLGAQMDADNGREGTWMLLDMMFSLIFLLELGLKLALNGFRGQFCGNNQFSNCFDAVLIFLDSVQLCIDLFLADMSKSMEEAGVPSASLFRTLRLARLTRILRLLRAHVFHELLSMIQGMIGGMSTLMWSVVLFGLIMYVSALIFCETMGGYDTENVSEYFDTVPRAMLTVFRCSFGDCSTRGGMPIFEWIYQGHSWYVTFLYCLFVFLITVGLFNVISAIFVESTMEAAKELELLKKRHRLDDDQIWAKGITALIRMLLSEDGNVSDAKLSDSMDAVMEVDVSADALDRLLKHREVVEVLKALDIDPSDNKYLTDILDPDMSGTISVLELVEGLKRLRGEPRRSDIVTVDLMMRSMQQKLDILTKRVEGLVRYCRRGGQDELNLRATQ
eukprot:TRINITY_DN40101_c0_g1_i1.p1 TRINITY_DN40101_c0_g1~~TRINITY_DN40101_c0_g1_i1.p1  ORF type:complete len:588 (+),score=118.93 TRINITY_DN40101_c0_g1_i1:136-1764(+)